MQPPHWADRFLTWYCHPELLDEVQGDLHEMFYMRLDEESPFKARLLYILEVLKSFKPSNIKSPRQGANYPNNHMPMIRNFLRIAMRNLNKHRVYTGINVIGLALGLACTLLITLYVLHERSFDRFHSKADQIYRVNQKFFEGSNLIEYSASIPWAVGPAIANDYPDITVTRIYQAWQKDPLVSRDEQSFYEDNLFFVDTTFLDVFDFKFLKGNASTALANPQSVVLTESTARRYFGDQDPVNHTIALENALDLTVTGVVEDVPSNSHFHFDLLVPLLNIGDIFEATGNRWGWEGWYWNPVHTYLVLPERYEAAQFEKELENFVNKNFPENLREGNFMLMQSLTDIHLNSHLYQELEVNGSEESITIAISIGLFILIIASINFVNLTTASSIQRSKEVVVRKLMGSSRRQLILQFFGESILISLISLAVAVALVALTLPLFERLVVVQLNLSYLVTVELVIAVVCCAVFLGIVSGFYPALLLSAFNPAQALRSVIGGGKKSLSKFLRKLLVVFQFAISIVLVIAAAMIYKQYTFLKAKPLGFDKEQVVMVPIRGTSIVERQIEFKQRLNALTTVISSATMSDILGKDVPNRPFGVKGYESRQDLPGLFTDHDFLKTFGVKLLDGRDFNIENEADSRALLINESMLEVLKDKDWEGQHIVWGRKGRPVIGVVEDFNFADLKRPIDPLVIGFAPSFISYCAVRVAPGEVSPMLAELETIWSQFEPERPFIPFFLDERLNQQYNSEQNISEMIGYFSTLAIFIACLGLSGLATYTIHNRLKEIGIRKVLGASIASIVGLVSKDFLLLVVISNLIAWPVAWYLMNQWLQDFTYRINIRWELFFVAGAIALLIAMITTGIHSLRAANTNPVNTIKED